VTERDRERERERERGQVFLWSSQVCIYQPAQTLD